MIFHIISWYFNVPPSKTSVIVHCQVQNCRGYLKNLQKIFTSQVGWCQRILLSISICHKDYIPQMVSTFPTWLKTFSHHNIHLKPAFRKSPVPCSVFKSVWSLRLLLESPLFGLEFPSFSQVQTHLEARFVLLRSSRTSLTPQVLLPCTGET